MSSQVPAPEPLIIEDPSLFASPFRKIYLNHQRLIIGTISVAIFLALWESIVRLRLVNPLFTSSPTLVLQAGRSMFAAGGMWHHISTSLNEFVIGFGLAVLVGVIIGILAGWFKIVRLAIEPFLSALYATPRVAFIPLLIIWVGIGIWSKIWIVFLGAFFPIAVNTIVGMSTLDSSLLRVARSFGANDIRIFSTLALPSVIPFLIAGLRLGLGRGLVGIVVGELYASNAGVGYLIAVYGQTFQTDRMMVSIGLLAIFGMLTVEALTRLEHRFERWRP